ncbi:MAG: Rrf2 family transcriptional regulator [Acidobacteria bacterium]|nr:Rrf2 family transcriptional regulator [Acidobacteriota bacterium]
MPITLPRSAAYAISAMAYIASQPRGRRCGVQEISRQQDIPISFLGKILQLLRRQGLLRSVRGIGGGYQLAVPAEQIRLVNIVTALGESTRQDQCLLHSKACAVENPCVLHNRLASLRSQFEEVLENTSVADLVSDSASGGDAREKEKEPA